MRQGNAFAEQSSIGFLELTQIGISQYGSIVDCTLYSISNSLFWLWHSQSYDNYLKKSKLGAWTQ